MRSVIDREYTDLYNTYLELFDLEYSDNVQAASLDKEDFFELRNLFQFLGQSDTELLQWILSKAPIRTALFEIRESRPMIKEVARYLEEKGFSRQDFYDLFLGTDGVLVYNCGIQNVKRNLQEGGPNFLFFLKECDSLAMGMWEYINEAPYLDGRDLKLLVSMVETAVAQNIQMRFRHRKNPATVTIDPYAVIWADGTPYLLGYDAAKNDIQHYRVEDLDIIQLCNTVQSGVVSSDAWGIYTECTFDTAFRLSNITI